MSTNLIKESPIDLSNVEHEILVLNTNIKELEHLYQSLIYAIGVDMFQIDIVCQTILQQFTKVRDSIMGLRKQINSANRAECEPKIKEYIHQAEELMKEYREIKTKYTSKYREEIFRSVSIQQDHLSEVERNELTDMIIASPSTNKIYGDMQQQALIPNQRGKDRAVCNLVHLREQYQDLITLERAIIDLQNIFIDMAFLVEAQDEQVTNIQHNIEDAEVYVEGAVENLTRARIYKSKERKKCCCLGGICLLGTACIGAMAGLRLAACTIQ